jgi:hypothetical protein
MCSNQAYSSPLLEEGEDMIPSLKTLKEIARKKNRRFLRDTEVNRFGEYIKNFFLARQATREKNGVRKVPEVATTHQATPGVPGATWWVVGPSGAHLAIYYFPKFLKIPKLTESKFVKFS